MKTLMYRTLNCKYGYQLQGRNEKSKFLNVFVKNEKNRPIFQCLSYFSSEFSYNTMEHSVSRPFPIEGALEHFKTFNTSCVVFAW